MITIKNIRPGILMIPDAGLRLTPGQKAEVRESTKQIERLVASGHLARVGDAETQAKSEPANTTEPAETPDLSKMTAQQAIASVAEMDDPERIKAAIESEKRRSVLDALMKKREEVGGGAE
ncbi:hypothetical protein KQH29_01080 [bacterium]|nr:hypothetical protein [bacterium]